jgi:membrane associated rhomboid family serine protease
VIPFKDENPTVLTPVVTIGIIALNTIVWLVVQGAGSEPALTRSVCELGLIPGELLGRVPAGTAIPMGRGVACVMTNSPSLLSPLTSMFLHGGWFHLIGNMWFFWVFGNNIEDAMGHGRFVAFYLICGLLAAAAQVASGPSSPIPMVGASGAISGVMGAYLVLYPRVRVHTLIFLGIFFTWVRLPAYIMLLFWIFLQFLGGLPALGGAGSGGGVAFMAHIGGFVAGALLIRPFSKPELLAQHKRPMIEVHRWDGLR